MEEQERKYIKLPPGKVTRKALRLRFGKLLRAVPFEYPKGWDPLVFSTLEAIESAITEIGQDHINHVEISQIKEKFGGLRIYMRSPVDVAEILREAEAISLSTCIFCGGEGQMLNDAWVHPACDACEAARIKDRDF